MKEDTRNPYAVRAGLRIKRARESLGLSLEQLSKNLKGTLSGSRISNYEQGTRLPGPSEVVILSRQLGPSPAYLLGIAEEDTLTPQEADLLRDFRALPERERNEYARRIAAIALIHREPVADERVEEAFTPPPKGSNKPKKRV